MSGIYSITNKTNNNIYIGRTLRSFAERWKEHINKLNSNTHNNLELQKDWNKYSEDNFEFSIVEGIFDLKEIPLKEYLYISKQGKDNCYNEIYRKAQNTLNAIEHILTDSGLKVYLECTIDEINWSMIVKDLNENRVYYFIQKLENKKNIAQRKEFISQSDKRVLIDIQKPIRNYHNDREYLYNLIKKG